MKQPTIMYEGKECVVDGIEWFQSNGELNTVSFTDEHGKRHLAFDKHFWDVEGYNENGILHTDLKEALAHNGEVE